VSSRDIHTPVKLNARVVVHQKTAADLLFLDDESQSSEFETACSEMQHESDGEDQAAASLFFAESKQIGTVEKPKKASLPWTTEERYRRYTSGSRWRVREKESVQADERGRDTNDTSKRLSAVAKKSISNSGEFTAHKGCVGESSRQSKPWTDEEKEIFEAAYEEVGRAWGRITELLPGRNLHAVRQHAKSQGYTNPTKPKIAWTDKDKAILKAAYEEYGNDWTTIASLLPGRTSAGVKWHVRSQPYYKSTRPYNHWTEEEKATLEAAYGKFGKDWKKIAKRLPGRSEDAVEAYAKTQPFFGATRGKPRFRGRGPKSLWTEEERAILGAAHEEFGNDWSEIAKRLPGRSEAAIEACAKRQLFFKATHGVTRFKGQRPRSFWTDEERTILGAAYEEFGNDWSEIAKRLPGRSEAAIEAYAKKQSFFQATHGEPRSSGQRSKTRWTDKERAVLRAAHEEFGNDWSEIAKQLPGRSKHSIKHEHYRRGYHIMPYSNQRPLWADEEKDDEVGSEIVERSTRDAKGTVGGFSKLPADDRDELNKKRATASQGGPALKRAKFSTLSKTESNDSLEVGPEPVLFEI